MATHMTKTAKHRGDITLLLRFPDMGREVWIKWDPSAEVYELFDSALGIKCLGHADTMTEARAVACAIAEEWMAG